MLRWGHAVIYHFPAAYPGRCGGCNEPFAVGDEVFYAQPEDVLMAWECCGPGEVPDSVASLVTPADKVMPRGKTVQDRCERCFQIPASNGMCGCDT